MYIWRRREREIYFEELVHMVVEAGESKICWVAQMAGDPGKI